MSDQNINLAVEALKAKDYQAAERAFSEQIKVLASDDGQYNLVSSYLGLAKVLSDDIDGLLLCRDAASNEVFDGQVYLNLACAEWSANNRRRAVDAIRRGVKIDAANHQLNRACAQLDCRKKCCFGFLPRGHKLNRIFGRLRRRSGQPVTVHHLLFSAG